MDEPVSVSIPALVIIAGTSAASFTALFYLFQRHISGTPLLAYEPRHRVPWGPVFALVAILIPLAGIGATILMSLAEPDGQIVAEEKIDSAVEDDQTAAEESNDFVTNALFTSTLMLTFVAVVSFFLRDYLAADGHDLGLPQSGQQFVADVGLGVFACVASMLPIYAIMFLLTKLLEPESEHPMIDELQQSHTPAMMLVGILMVVIAAPLFEEFSFRLLLQGWLEKWEDEHIGYSGTMRDPSSAPELAEIADVDDQDTEDAVLLAIPQEPVPLPRGGVLQDLPHGWLPILISGTLFGLAHWGHGVSPVPLVLFGIVLGYLYQRTHRLVPSITAHALFNSYSMLMLWLSF